MATTKTKVLGIRLRGEEIEELERLAEKQGLMPSELARQVLRDYLKSQREGKNPFWKRWKRIFA